MKKFFKEFETFAVKGNAIDLAVGVIIGGAFAAITNSLVNDILNPLIGLITGPVDFSDKAIVLRSATETTEALTVGYGVFVNTLINFLIVGFVLFLLVRQMNRLREKIADKPEETDDKKSSAPPEPPADIKLLTEIRDALVKKENK